MRKAEPTSNPLFDRFWAAYPRKVGKPKAQTAFARLRTTEREVDRMLAAIACQSKAYGWDRKENWKYIPHPATWLNQRRWEDEIVGTDTEPDPAVPYTGCCAVIE